MVPVTPAGPIRLGAVDCGGGASGWGVVVSSTVVVVVPSGWVVVVVVVVVWALTAPPASRPQHRVATSRAPDFACMLFIASRLQSFIVSTPIIKLWVTTLISQPGPTGQRARIPTSGSGMILPCWFNFLSFWATIGRRSRLQSMQTRGK